LFPRKEQPCHCCQERILDCLAHGSFSFFSRASYWRFTCCYFPEGVSPAGRVVQNAVVGVVKEQKQPLGQGWMALHVPLQAKPLGSLRNCRAETVPAQSTAMAMAASEKFCMVFLMIGLTFNYKAG
jgi:hypothetical protein